MLYNVKCLKLIQMKNILFYVVKSNFNKHLNIIKGFLCFVPSLDQCALHVITHIYLKTSALDHFIHL